MKNIISVLVLIALLFAFAACGRGRESTPTEEIMEEITEATANEVVTEAVIPIVRTEITQAETIGGWFPEAVYSGFVDERFELISLIFRLAGWWEHGATRTPYQQELSSRFSEFADHRAVSFARGLQLGYDAALNFAVHMERTADGFALISNRISLYDKWNRVFAAQFIDLVNEFYIDTNFAAFFRENVPYFLEHSERFESQLYSHLNKDWFYAYGLSPDAMRVVISPASTNNSYGAYIRSADMSVLALYGALPGATTYSRRWISFLVREFAHGFTNDIAAELYRTNPEFRQISKDTVDMIRLPFYTTSRTISYEYVARVYTILYMVENGRANLISLLQTEVSQGFIYIMEVYAMITGEEPLDLIADTIRTVLGVDYLIVGAEKFTSTVPGVALSWRFLDLMGAELDLSNFPHSTYNNTIGTSLGDVVYVILPNGTSDLRIDLGPASEGMRADLRSHFVFPLNFR